ncbi:NADPH-dependent FMN reductase [Flavobacterium sp.]|jgi:chromate reductase|uniref:NADPH-dependent FMN reductase n=1 Tax=Flavobacterium sp. TaxID=239 RepID=UPI0022C94827|nr:NAD(P)H-dependent oxidoreductase [Flavobacterium sp.]MCZ8144159.1 NAD(P)H-dependent oxidoreductase [Flavobacterium sp.]MCZ8297531.1 NAD(P)H-dependent oxidoreductase [Flavobacterium sp.]MCZ8365977.1 NAD(P)H-dependent oxidoreductase [Flavobacterium sp.]
MKKIIAFGGSTSQTSINKQLATYAAHLVADASVEVLDLNDYSLPLFSVDLEKEGIPQAAHDFYTKIGSADLLVVSLAEHNGAYSAAFKNLLDWTSRINPKNFQNKPMFLMATSPGARGGASVLEMANSRFPYQGAAIVGTFSLPNFYDHMIDGVMRPEYHAQLVECLASMA